jgi:pyruvate,water dikinase
VIYASWDWDHTVEDAMHHSGFASFEEQAQALAVKRSMKW